jgi:hypothetical protein
VYGFFGLPERAGTDINVYRANTPAGSTVITSEIWRKPRGVKFVYGFLLGGGGGAGAGLGSGGTTVGGGSGGAAAASLAFLAPAALVPDVLYLSVGGGGTGGIAGGAAPVAGQPSVISLSPNIPTTLSAGQLFRVTGGGVGAVGVSAGQAAASTGGTITSQFLSLSAVALIYTVAGQPGVAGSNGSAGASVAWGSATTSPASAGASGGGTSGTTTDHAGGNITAPDVGFEPLIVTIPGGAIASRGQDGICSLHYTAGPFYSTGGSGGGSNHGLTGGRGGDGAYGSGGGAGGGGATGGAGGNGGDGLIVMAAF